MAAANDIPQTDEMVMMAVLERDWNNVKAAMVGDPQHSVALSVHFQEMLLSEALREEEWTFINSVVTGGFPFAPKVLDKVLDCAMTSDKLEIVSNILLSSKRYKVDSGLVLRAMRIFCSHPDWLQTAYELAKVFPSDVSSFSLVNYVYFPLQVTYPHGNATAQLITDLLQSRFTFHNGAAPNQGEAP